MRTRTGITLRIAGALMVACCAVAAFARSVDEVLPGQRLFGELERSDELTVVVRVVDGTVLDVTAKSWKGSDLRPILSLRNGAGDVVQLIDYLKESKKGNKVAIKNLPLDAGAYQLTIEGEFGTMGAFDLVTAATLPKRLKGERSVTTPGTPVAIWFDALPGDVVQLKVKAPKKGGLSPVIDRMVEEDGTATLVGETRKSPKLTVAGVGKHRFEVSGADASIGAFKYVLRIKRAKPPKQARDLQDLDARGSVTGRVVIEGAVSRDASPAKMAAAATDADDGSVRAGEIIVAAAPGATREHVLEALAEEVPSLIMEVAAEMTSDGPWLMRVPSLSQGTPDRRRRRQTLTLTEAFARSPFVAYAEANRRVCAVKTPNDLRYSQQSDLQQMNVPKAWDLETGDPAIVIAIVDTGIWNHPDLDSKRLPGYDFVSDPGNAQDGNGIDNDPTDSARDFHGTHVAGTAAAATSNGIGIAGVAWNCRFLPVRVLGRDGGSFFDIAAGLRWAVGLPVAGVPDNAYPARVVNMSLGSTSSSSTMQAAVSAAKANGAVLVAASGNNASSAPFYPAAYSEVISVYALDANFHWASYSNWGDSITVGAPGGDLNAGLPGILSTYIDGGNQPTYTQLQGTSMASPHVAGLVALMLSAKPSLSPDAVRGILIDTAVDLGPPEFDVDYGHGAVDAYAALRAVAGPPVAPPSLRFWPSALEFGRLTDSRVVQVRNEGTGAVTITSIAAQTTGTGDWLSATTGSSTVPTTITVNVDHDVLFDGTFEGSVVINTSVGQAVVPVRVTRAPPPSLGVVRVKALGPNGQVLGTTTTSQAKDWEYTLDGLPLGTYTIAAEADLDADLKLTRIDEFEGRWPLLDRPETLDVATSELDYADIDVPLLRRDMQFQFDGVGGGQIEGAVAVRAFDARDGTPIVGAAAFLGDGQVAAETDANGRALLAGQFSAGQTISVVADGYVTRTRIGANGQYQAFALEPREAPESVVISAVVTGLPPQSDHIVLHVGTTRTDVAWTGETSQTIDLDVPRRRPAEAVSVVVYDGDDEPIAAALDSLQLTSTPTATIDLPVAPPAGGARGRVVEASLPISNFTTAGASLETLITVRLDRDQWVPIGWAPVTPMDATTVWWASLLDIDPPLKMRFEAFSLDVTGRFSRRGFVGTTTTIAVARPMALPSPGIPQSPGGGLVISPFAPEFFFGAPQSENLIEVVILDDTGSEVWRIVAEGPATSITLPGLPFGGLVPGADYTWRVELREVPGLIFASHREDDLRGDSTTFTRSSEAAFSVD